MALLLSPIPQPDLGGGILYSRTPQVLDPITNPSFGGPWGLPVYTPLQLQYDVLQRSLSSRFIHTHTHTHTHSFRNTLES